MTHKMVEIVLLKLAHYNRQTTVHAKQIPNRSNITWSEILQNNNNNATATLATL